MYSCNPNGILLCLKTKKTDARLTSDGLSRINEISDKITG